MSENTVHKQIDAMDPKDGNPMEVDCQRIDVLQVPEKCEVEHCDLCTKAICLS